MEHVVGKIKKWTRKARDLFDRDPHKKEVTPYRDWFLLMVASLVLTIFFGVAGQALYLHVRSERTVPDDDRRSVSLPLTLDEKRLQDVLEAFREKEDQKALLERTPPRVPSPRSN